MTLRLSSHSSWLLPQLTFLCANISWAMLHGGASSSNIVNNLSQHFRIHIINF